MSDVMPGTQAWGQLEVWSAARCLRRKCQDAIRIGRRASELPENNVVRIHGEPIVGDLGEKRLASMGAALAQMKVQDEADQLLDRLKSMLEKP